MTALQALSADIAAGTQWVYWWVNYMSLVFVLAIPFSFVRVEARWTLLALALQFPALVWLHSQIGYVRLLGITHVIFWTPLLVYLWSRRNRWKIRETLAGKWIALLFATMAVSLVIDYTDVVRYALGDR